MSWHVSGCPRMSWRRLKTTTQKVVKYGRLERILKTCRHSSCNNTECVHLYISMLLYALLYCWPWISQEAIVIVMTMHCVHLTLLEYTEVGYCCNAYSACICTCRMCSVIVRPCSEVSVFSTHVPKVYMLMYLTEDILGVQVRCQLSTNKCNGCVRMFSFISTW